MENELVLIQGQGHRVVKPGVNGGGGHVRFHEGEHFGPDIRGGIHRGTSLFL